MILVHLLLLIILPNLSSCFPFPELSFLGHKHIALEPLQIPSDQKLSKSVAAHDTKSKKYLKPMEINTEQKNMQPTTTATFPPLIPKRMILNHTKVKTENSLTYKNVHIDVIAMLRQRLNEDEPSWDADNEVETAPPTNKTSSSACSFLAGSLYTLTGTCSSYGACRVENLVYPKHVRISN